MNEELKKNIQQLLRDDNAILLVLKDIMLKIKQDSYTAGRTEAKEIVICAAVKAKDGTLIRCHRHSDGYDKLHDMGKPLGEREEGFITSANRFVDRAEGLRLQLEAGIISAEGKYGTQLYSEDLY